MKSILVVEDEPALAEVLEVILSGAGFDVVVAYDGRRALACLEERCPDLVLTDLMMPFVDGAELAREIHGRPALAHVPVILMSAVPEAMARVPRETYSTFSRKPFDFQAVLAVVEDAIGAA